MIGAEFQVGEVIYYKGNSEPTTPWCRGRLTRVEQQRGGIQIIFRYRRLEGPRKGTVGERVVGDELRQLFIKSLDEYAEEFGANP